jgi:hypothetical protein
MTCLRCAYFDVPQYDDELPRRPHCGAILAAPNPVPVSWLAQWPAPRRSTLANLFYAAVRCGLTAPSDIVEQVTREMHQRLQWATDFKKRQWWSQVLNTISDDLRGAQTYAAEVLATEQLPRAERARQKQERAKTFIQQAMQGKPATKKQLSLLRCLGHLGPLPSDRADASMLIDTLVRTKGGAA